MRRLLLIVGLAACSGKATAQPSDDAPGTVSPRPPRPPTPPQAAPSAPSPSPSDHGPVPPVSEASNGLEESPVGVPDQPTDTQATMVRALASRDAPPTCTDLEALSSSPAHDLQWIAEHVTMPPTAGVRAAQCLVIGHADDANDTLRAWVTEPMLKGFGWVVLRNLDDVELSLAIDLATLALTAGPDPKAAAKRIRTSERPELKALADDPDLKPR